MIYKKFFLTGSASTGTTLLCRCISDHPNAFCFFETQIQKHAFGGKTSTGHSRRIKEHGFSDEQMFALKNKLIKGDSKTFFNWYDESSEIVKTLFEKPNLTHIGDKSTFFTQSKGVVNAISSYPKIFTIRDPRDVWYSGQFHREGKRNYLNSYLNNVDYTLKTLDSTTLIVRFEDLVLYPENTMKKVYEFIGVLDDQTFLHRTPMKYDRRFNWIPNAITDFNPSIINKWKKSGFSVPMNPKMKTILDKFYK